MAQNHFSEIQLTTWRCPPDNFLLLVTGKDTMCLEVDVGEGLRRKTERLGKRNAYHCAGNCCYCSQTAAAHARLVDYRETCPSRRD